MSVDTQPDITLRARIQIVGFLRKSNHDFWKTVKPGDIISIVIVSSLSTRYVPTLNITNISSSTPYQNKLLKQPLCYETTMARLKNSLSGMEYKIV